MLQNISLYFQWLSSPAGNSMQHDRDMTTSGSLRLPLTQSPRCIMLHSPTLISID
jgi:hypothetical protein